MTDGVGSNRAVKGIGPLAVGLLVQIFCQAWLARAGYHFEEFRDLQVAQGLARGATLYGDMDWIYGPLHPYALHALFKLTGLPLEIMTIRYVAVALGAVASGGAYAFARRMLSPGWAAAAAFLTCWVFLPPRPTYNHHWAAAAVIVWLPIAARYVERAGKRSAAWMAVMTSIALLSKPFPIGVALMACSMIVLSVGWVKVGPRRTLIAAVVNGCVLLFITGLSYGWIADGSGWASLIDALSPKTFQDEQIGFSLIPPALLPSTFVTQWNRLLGGGWGGAVAHLILLTDILAVVWGGSRLLRSLVGGKREDDAYYWILVPAALLVGSESFLFERLILLYGGRAPVTFLLVILVRDALRSRPGESPRWKRFQIVAGSLGVVMLTLPMMYLVGARVIPLASGIFGRHGFSEVGERFSQAVAISGMRGIRMSKEATRFYEDVLREIDLRSKGSGSVALWSYFPVVAFQLGERNIFSERMHLFAHDLRTVRRGSGGRETTLLEDATRLVRERRPALLVFMQHLKEGAAQMPEPAPGSVIGGVRYQWVYSRTANISANWIERALIYERELE